MNPYVSLEQAKSLKEAGYDQTVEKTDMHYVKTRISEDIWLIHVSGDLDYIVERYAAPTVEEMIIEIGKGRETTELLDKAFKEWIQRGNEGLKESLVRAFESIKKKRS